MAEIYYNVTQKNPNDIPLLLLSPPAVLGNCAATRTEPSNFAADLQSNCY